MNELYLSILNMSYKASYVILFVIVVRLLLKKAPKVISYVLWVVVAFRLIIPFSFESMFSLLPRSTNTVLIPPNIIYQETPQIHSGLEVVDTFVSNILPRATTTDNVNPLKSYIDISMYIWILGIVVLVIYSFVSILRLKKQLKNAQLIEHNIFEAKNLKTPFVLGFIKPKIYLPAGLSMDEKNYILLHEQTHINRKDHMIKTLGFIIVSIHWFNPLVWLSFMLMSTDMELSCDEKVLKEINEDIKKPYANSLLSLATKRQILNGSPLAFGEGNVKRRIKNVLNYKKSTFWVITIALVTAIVVTFGLFTNPIINTNKSNSTAAQLLKNKVNYYAGNQQKVVNIINLLTFPEDVHYNPLMMASDIGQYTIIVNLTMLWENNHLYGDEETQQLFQDNAMIMFALIKDVKTVTFRLSDGISPRYFRYTREWANQQYGKDAHEFAKSEEEINKLINGSAAITKMNDMKKFIEDNISAILSSPMHSSNPYDYINEHRNEYKSIIENSNEDVLEYLLSQFETNNVDGLRGHIIMILCKELLGPRNNVVEGTLSSSPQTWYNALNLNQEIILPDYVYDGQIAIEKLVYDTLIKYETEYNTRGGFTVIAPKIFGSYEEEDKLKVFVTTHYGRYMLYGDSLVEDGGGSAPNAITYRKDSNGKYILEKIEYTEDGTRHFSSIEEFCRMPVSNKEIKGLAKTIINYHGDNYDLIDIFYNNLYKHLKKNGIKDAILRDPYGDILFTMRDLKYTN